MANLVGAQHVALGLDYVRDVDRVWAWVGANPQMWPSDGIPTRPSQFMQPEQILELTALMLRHGYGEDDVRGILGENFLRVAEQVWDAAAP
jgi:membrane dipeptidase